MATSNELFQDAILRRAHALQSFSKGLGDDIMELMNDTESDLRDLLERRLAKLTRDGVDFGPETTARLRVLEESIRSVREAAFDGSEELWSQRLQELAKAEASFIDESLRDVSPVALDTVVPTAEMLARIASSTPLQGKVLSDWASKIAENDLHRIMDSIKIGMAQGQGVDDITRRVLGSGDLDGADGVTQLARNEARSITNTAVQTIANEARAAFFELNDDVFEEEVVVATLDAVTTPICQSLDGNTYPVGEGPQFPIHWNCRTIRVALISDKLLGKRPANAATDPELEGLTGAERKAKVRELVGQVPASVNYEEWLGRQTATFQEEVLGPTRAALFREGGLSLDKFVNKTTGKPVTIEQLRKKEPEAFKRVSKNKRRGEDDEEEFD